jgi:signal transduction histidine kinase
VTVPAATLSPARLAPTAPPDAGVLLRVLAAQREVTALVRDRTAALACVATRALELLGADGALVERTESFDLVAAASAGTLVPAAGRRAPMPESLAGLAVRAGRALVAVDGPDGLPGAAAAQAAPGARAVLVAPVAAGDRPAGTVITVASARPDAFTPDDLADLALLAENLAPALEQADAFADLAAADRVKTDLVGMIGHEIGTPLAAIRGYTDVLREDWAQLSARERTRMLAVVGRHADRLDHLQREVLTMVALDAGALRVERRAVGLVEALEGAVRAAEAGRVAVSCPPGLHALAHPGQLEQVLVNLLTNAAKYGGGATLVSAEAVADRVELRVRDDGPGVAEAFRAQLFDWATRAVDSGAAPGTGLGLYIARGLAIANGGRLRHEPTVPHGATFVLELEAA